MRILLSSKGRPSLPHIDLNRDRSRAQKQVLARNRVAASGLAALMSGMVLILLPLTVLQWREQGRTAKSVRELTEMQTRARALSAESNALEARVARLARYTESRRQRQVWQSVLLALAADSPASLYLNSTQIRLEDKVLNAAIQGEGETMSAVSELVRRLSARPGISRVRLIETAVNPALGPQGVQFTLAFAVALR